MYHWTEISHFLVIKDIIPNFVYQYQILDKTSKHPKEALRNRLQTRLKVIKRYPRFSVPKLKNFLNPGDKPIKSIQV